jgi:hypothetical protein
MSAQRGCSNEQLGPHRSAPASHFPSVGSPRVQRELHQGPHAGHSLALVVQHRHPQAHPFRPLLSAESSVSFSVARPQLPGQSRRRKIRGTRKRAMPRAWVWIARRFNREICPENEVLCTSFCTNLLDRTLNTPKLCRALGVLLQLPLVVTIVSTAHTRKPPSSWAGHVRRSTD